MDQEQAYLSLRQLNAYIEDVLQNAFEGAFWLKAEISQINFHRSGHCYLELVEHSGQNIVAKARATIWRSALSNIRFELGSDTDNILARGKEVLIQATVNFHAVYGLSISVHRVDSRFALGELERKKQETIDQLEKEELLELNSQLPMPLVAQKIAVISSDGSSGQQDFLKQVRENPYKIKLDIEHFHASVQGVGSESEICERLDQLMGSDFDVIVMIRGGGSKLDLETFNSYEIAKRIAIHDLPVITGIGHETDVSVADIVAHMSLKTPTAAAAFLIDRAAEFLRKIGSDFYEILHRYELKLHNSKSFIQNSSKQVNQKAVHAVQIQRSALQRQGNRVIRFARTKVSSESGKIDLRRDILVNKPLDLLRERKSRDRLTEQIILGRSGKILSENRAKLSIQKEVLVSKSFHILHESKSFIQKNEVLLNNAHPDRILQRGFSVVRKSNKAITENTKLKDGDLLEIELYKRKIYAQFLNEEPEWQKLKTLLTKKPQKS